MSILVVPSKRRKFDRINRICLMGNVRMSFRKYFWIIALLAGAGVANAAETTFRIATLAPDGSSWMTAMRAATDEITARTDNRVRFRFFPGGVMGNDESV